MNERAKQSDLPMLIYLYCVTNKVPDLTPLSEYRVCSVSQDDIYAVFSRVSRDEFSQKNLERNLNDLEWLKTRVMIHERIIEGVMKNTCVIPFKFATLFETENNLKAMLEKYASDIRTNLKNLDGKEEWGIKIYCHLEGLKEAACKDERLRAIDTEISSASAGKGFFLRKKREELLQAIVNESLNIDVRDCFERLSKQSIQSCLNKLLPKEVTEKQGEMILNAAFLVEKKDVDSFIGVVENLKRQYQESGLSGDCTGPWPPYNFCQLAKERV